MCLIQPLVFGDGGITTLGLTVTNLALIPAFIGFPLLLALRTRIPLPVACGLTAALCVMLAAVVFTLEVTFGAAGSIDTRAIAATTLGSYAVVALVEGVLTALVIRGILSLRPDLVYVNRRQVAT